MTQNQENQQLYANQQYQSDTNMTEIKPQEQNIQGADIEPMQQIQASDIQKLSSGALVQEQVLTPELKRVQELQQTLKANPQDFNAQCEIIKNVEKAGDIILIREVFDQFLAEFPLCFGYWKRYADCEVKAQNLTQANKVWDRGVAAIPLIEKALYYCGSDYHAHKLWDLYINFEIGQGQTMKITNIYTRIIQQPIQELDRYYKQLQDFCVNNPLESILSQDEISSNKQIISKQRKNEVVTQNQQSNSLQEQDGQKQILEHSIDNQKQQQDTEDNQRQNNLNMLQENQVSKHQGIIDVQNNEQNQNAQNGSSSSIQENSKQGYANGLQEPIIEINESTIKDTWMNQNEEVYKSTKLLLNDIKVFEAQIKRLYFHVKPLDNMQLFNWRRYQDFVIEKRSFREVVCLFERCLVSCALYSEFWQRYILYLKKHGDHEAAKNALDRSINHFCKKKFQFVLFAAHCYELWAEYEKAQKAYQKVTKDLAPNYLEAIIQYAYYLKRQEQYESACNLLENFIIDEKFKTEKSIQVQTSSPTNKNEDSNGHQNTTAEQQIQQQQQLFQGQVVYVYVVLQFGYLVISFLPDLSQPDFQRYTQKYRGIYQEALRILPQNLELIEGVIQLESSNYANKDRVQTVLDLYKQFSKPIISRDANDKVIQIPMRFHEEMSNRGVTFGYSNGTVEQHDRALQSHFERFVLPSQVVESITQSKKRPYDQANGNQNGSQSGSKQARIETNGVQQSQQNQQLSQVYGQGTQYNQQYQPQYVQPSYYQPTQGYGQYANNYQYPYQSYQYYYPQ